MLRTNSVTVFRFHLAMSFRASQNASSRLTLVLCPSRTIERFMMCDFIGHSPLGGFQIPLTNQYLDTPIFGRGYCWARPHIEEWDVWCVIIPISCERAFAS